MKRSEVVQILFELINENQKTVNDLNNIYRVGNKKYPDLDDTNLILLRLEELGMLPPTTIGKPLNKWDVE